MTWVDYGMLSDLLIAECLDIFGVVENVKTLLANSMETWRIMLYAGDFE